LVQSLFALQKITGNTLSMKTAGSGSISKYLYMIVMLAILPAIAILLYSGLEQRRHSIEQAQNQILLLTHTMAEAQHDLTNSVKQMLATLSLMPQVQSADHQVCNEIFRSVLEQNPNCVNITLTDLNGKVVASGKPLTNTNLGDRKHVRDALETKDFSIGEYIISRIGAATPAFAFAFPVFDKNHRLTGVLTAPIKLSHFSTFYDFSNLPEQSFVGLTDHKGIRLFFYPPKEDTNPVGKPIKANSWEKANNAKEPGIFIGRGTDGVRRIFAFEPVRFKSGATPYLYVWTATPEAYALAPANAMLIRNLLLLLLVTVLSLVIAWLIGNKALLSPIQSLVNLTQKFAQGNLETRSVLSAKPDEFGKLTLAFYDMAETLAKNQRTLLENEARFRLLMDSLNAVVYVADMNTYEILFVNEYGKKEFGDIAGQLCWQSLQKGQTGPCPFCTNKYLLDREGKPGEVYCWEFQNTVTGKWFHINDRAITWSDGQIVRLEIATEITDRKKDELIKTALIEKLEKALAEIKTLQGILPICSICKNIRNDEGYYEQIESYIHKHSGVDFSHTICPACMKKNYPEEYDAFNSKKD
jgi:HAMP domain-containing protein